ncbi:MAG: RecX family transcriptional regulator [Oscillospiraceae bacterium]|nr:RecX family transcriptional regulator [Oscillospiraceae bacterium]
MQSEFLCIGDDLTTERIAELKALAFAHRSYEYALYLLEKRAYSYRELYEKLMAVQDAQEEIVLQTLEKLMRYGFVNDARYAESLARHFVADKRFGIKKAAYEMQHRGLSQEDIEDALAEYDQPERISENLLVLLSRKYARYLYDPEDKRAVDKVIAALVRRGYTYQQIRFAIEDYYAMSEESNIEGEV